MSIAYILIFTPIITFTMGALFIQAAYLIPKTVEYHYLINGEPITEVKVFGPYWHIAFIGFIFISVGVVVSYLIIIDVREEYKLIKKRSQ